MSERFVRGWKVCPQKLQALVGSKSVSETKVLESRSNEACVEEVMTTLGDEDEDEGTEITTSALSEIFEGALRADDAYAYGRVTELLLVRPRPFARQPSVLRSPVESRLLSTHAPVELLSTWPVSARAMPAAVQNQLPANWALHFASWVVEHGICARGAPVYGAEPSALRAPGQPAH